VNSTYPMNGKTHIIVPKSGVDSETYTIWNEFSIYKWTGTLKSITHENISLHSLLLFVMDLEVETITTNNSTGEITIQTK